MSGIDYSKWDHFGDSSDDEEQETTAPRVTRLDKPSRISTTQGQDGFTVVPNESKPIAVPSQTTSSSSSSSDIPGEWTVKGGVSEITETTIYWTQERYSITMRLVAPEYSSFTVKVHGILSFVDRSSAAATASSSPRLVVWRKDKKSPAKQKVWFEGGLPHAVHYAQDDDKDIDWSVERFHERPYLVFTLYKAVPMEGVFIWWKRPLTQCPEIEWRSESDSSSNAAFQEAWAEAHKQFKAMVADKKKTSI